MKKPKDFLRFFPFQSFQGFLKPLAPSTPFLHQCRRVYFADSFVKVLIVFVEKKWVDGACGTQTTGQNHLANLSMIIDNLQKTLLRVRVDARHVGHGSNASVGSYFMKIFRCGFINATQWTWNYWLQGSEVEEYMTLSIMCACRF
jgi:hypothetical protein